MHPVVVAGGLRGEAEEGEAGEGMGVRMTRRAIVAVRAMMTSRMEGLSAEVGGEEEVGSGVTEAGKGGESGTEVGEGMRGIGITLRMTPSLYYPTRRTILGDYPGVIETGIGTTVVAMLMALAMANTADHPYLLFQTIPGTYHSA